MTRKLFLTLIISLFLLQTKAQCKDCQPKDDWKFAAGVTLYSNNLYVYPENFLEREPMEFSFRYKLKSKHVFKLNIPVSYKEKKSGTPTLSQYPTGEVSLEDYLEKLRDPDYIWASYHKVLYYNETLCGVSLGYDYNINLLQNLSIFPGINMAYNYLSNDSKYYMIDYHEIDANNNSEIFAITLSKNKLYGNSITLTPHAGLRYQFQNLLFEASLGYVLRVQKVGFIQDYSYIDGKTGIKKNGHNYFPHVGTYNYNNLSYSFSLFYTF